MSELLTQRAQTYSRTFTLRVTSHRARTTLPKITGFGAADLGALGVPSEQAFIDEHF